MAYEEGDIPAIKEFGMWLIITFWNLGSLEIWKSGGNVLILHSEL